MSSSFAAGVIAFDRASDTGNFQKIWRPSSVRKEASAGVEPCNIKMLALLMKAS
jgi:hypothetical protein